MAQYSKHFRKSLTAHKQHYQIFSIKAAEADFGDFSKLPLSLRVLLENLLRYQDDKTVTRDDIAAMHDWLATKTSNREIAYRPARVLMQDFTGVPAVVDLAAMRDAMVKLGGDAEKINPLSNVDLVIDHSVQVVVFGSRSALHKNVDLEMERNHERYEFLKWGQNSFKNFRVVPPGTGICHQVNLEYLAKVVWTKDEFAYPDTLVGTDSHTTMINGLGVLGWGVGGIEAEAAMLGQPVSMLIPEVIGVKLTGKLNEGVTATDLVLTVTEMLRKKGVVGKFVEFFGAGVKQLPLANRATIANMAPEYGATCGFFPIDEETIKYLHLSGRDEATIALVEAYAKEQGLWLDEHAEPTFTDVVHLDLSSVVPSLAGPKRPQDRVTLQTLPEATQKLFEAAHAKRVADELQNGDVVIAAITSCTNTSNPSVLMAAGLIAKKALALGLKTKPWVKTSLAPGSKVVTDYLEKANLQSPLDQLGFNLVGYGCTTCIGNSGPLAEEIETQIKEKNLIVSSVLSGNRNFEGRVHPLTKANWLASPPLVVIFALAGTTLIDISKDPIAQDATGKNIYLKDLWPTNLEVEAEVAKVDGAMFRAQYANVFSGDAAWQAIKVTPGKTYQWKADSSYIQNPPYFKHLSKQLTPVSNIVGAKILALFGDSITTDHISPAGDIKLDSPAGKYLQSLGISKHDFNSYGARRGNHEVMMRGTFANIRIKNEMVPGVEGGVTLYNKEMMPIYDASMKYQAAGVPLVIIAGKEYGTGSSRDWAAKGPLLLGVKAVITESFERIHRSNLVGMGILPLQFKNGITRQSLQLDGSETIDIPQVTSSLKPKQDVEVRITRADGRTETITVMSRIDTQDEVGYFENGGILQTVLREMVG